MSTETFSRHWNLVAARECWEWAGSRHPRRGYGQVTNDGKTAKAHRVMWRLTYGAIPDGLHVLHRCDNPPCINPAHLFLGTNADNVADRVRKGRSSRASVNRGEKNALAKLTWNKIAEIRVMLADGVSGKDIAEVYKISRSVVSNIKTGKRWTPVA